MTTEPLRIDTLIIKKPPEIHVKKNIGQIFKRYNVVEYKSPEDSLGVDSYNKAFAYAYLYAYLTGADINDTTVTLVASSHPRDLLRYLGSDPKLEAEKISKGIFYIKGERMPVQIVETTPLSKEENLWLSALRRGLEESTIERLINDCRQYGNETDAYMYAVMQANKEKLKGEFKMSIAKILTDDPEFVREIEKLGYGDITSAVARERTLDKLEFAQKLLKRNRPIDEIVEDTGLSREEVENLSAAI